MGADCMIASNFDLPHLKSSELVESLLMYPVFPYYSGAPCFFEGFVSCLSPSISSYVQRRDEDLLPFPP